MTLCTAKNLYRRWLAPAPSRSSPCKLAVCLYHITTCSIARYASHKTHTEAHPCYSASSSMSNCYCCCCALNLKTMGLKRVEPVRTFFRLISPKFPQLRTARQPPSPIPTGATSSPAPSPLPPSRYGRGAPRRARRSTRRLLRRTRERWSEEQTSEKVHRNGSYCLDEPASPMSAGAQYCGA